ncbi:chemotaxis protein CheW [Pseudoxanthomonas beigongshangi]
MTPLRALRTTWRLWWAGCGGGWRGGGGGAPAAPLQAVPAPVIADATAPIDGFDAAHEDVLERLLATTRGIAVADDPEAILALQQMENAPFPPRAAGPLTAPPVAAPAPSADTTPLPESGEIPMTSVQAIPAAPVAPAGDLITDDEFEALLDQLHGGAVPGARSADAAPGAASESSPPPAPRETCTKTNAETSAPMPVPPPAPLPAPIAPAVPPHAVPAHAKPVFEMLQRRRHDDDDVPASSPHGERRRASDRSTRWLRMRCDDQHYALELLKVQEVVLPATLLPLRGAAPHMLGVMNLRGQVVPVLDLGLYLGRAAITPDSHVRIVVLEENGEILGLRVSAVEDVTSLTEQQIEPPDNTRMCRITHPLFRGVARLAGRTVILLDASELLR